MRIHHLKSRAALAAGCLAFASSAAFAGEGIVEIPDDFTLFPDLGCAEFDRYETLTPNDTLSLITAYHNPEQALGYLVVYAVDEQGNAVAADHLIGQSMSINGIERFEYSVNPLDFRAAGEAGSLTDVDGDGEQDLDGAEYERLPDQLLVPRFIGQSGGLFDPLQLPSYYVSRLILIDLNSGNDFDTTVDFLIYNDNEEVFSSEATFRCWDSLRVTDISGAFRQSFLKDATDHNPLESVGGRETGWFRFDGHVANSSAATIADPGIYGVYVERVNFKVAADLPFESGQRDGHILPRSIFGDNSEAGGFTGVAADPVQRRRPGSLLVYPQFNNLLGELTLVTVTNTSPDQELRVHFVYRGRYGFGL
ncbi:MAG: hypothetical protein H6831_12955 [Planctomycetes bacterium]|nr:hypothetical protein [Planctomycetota bacterium]MCB9905307.1 hypothetical protein [Planctomycetota bacterium]